MIKKIELHYFDVFTFIIFFCLTMLSNLLHFSKLIFFKSFRDFELGVWFGVESSC